MNAPETRTYIDTVARLKGNAYAAVRVQVDVDTVDGMIRADAKVVQVKCLAEPLTREELEVEFLRGQLADAEVRLDRLKDDVPIETDISKTGDVTIILTPPSGCSEKVVVDTKAFIADVIAQHEKTEPLGDRLKRAQIALLEAKLARMRAS